MKNILSVLFFTVLLFSGYRDTIYDISINTIDDEPVSLLQFKGKKMLFVILPLSVEDSSVSAADLFALAKQYSDSLIVIGIPGEETGYSAADKDRFKGLYRGHPSNFIITKGLKVKKESGERQSLLFRWLTDRYRNNYFDQDVTGTGHKFFVDETGQLYAVLGPAIRLSSHVIKKILSKPVLKQKEVIKN